MYALNALIRHNQRAQANFVNSGGLDLLRRILNLEAKAFHHIKLQKKAITLVGDLLSDQGAALELQMRQNSGLWCNDLATLLQRQHAIMRKGSSNSVSNTAA